LESQGLFRETEKELYWIKLPSALLAGLPPAQRLFAGKVHFL
jgi:hypothetical protein